jgi:outer membrane lipoprotein-sorting protein
MREFIVAAIFVLAAVSLAGDALPPPSEADVQQWIKDLGSDDFKARAAAEDNLRQGGDVARAALQKALPSNDAEVQSRGSRVLAFLKAEPLVKQMMAALAQNIEADVVTGRRQGGAQWEMKGHLKSTGNGKAYLVELEHSMNQYRTRAIGDGTTVHIENAGKDQKVSHVQKATQATTDKMGMLYGHNIVGNLVDLLGRMSFTKVTEAKFDDTPVLVLEGAFKRPYVVNPYDRNRGEASLARFYVAKDTCMICKTEVLDARGDALNTIELSKIQKVEKFDEATFKYAVPSGARVIDSEQSFKSMLQQQGEE